MPNGQIDPEVVQRFLARVPRREPGPTFLEVMEKFEQERQRLGGANAPPEDIRRLEEAFRPAREAQLRRERAQPIPTPIRTIGQLKRVAQALRGVPADIQSQVLSRLTGIPTADPGMDALGRILFREQLRAPREARREAARERRFVGAQRERRLAREELKAHREVQREFQERQFRARQEETEAEVLKALDDLVQLRERFRQTGRQDAVSALNEVEVRLLLRLIKPRARITKEE